MTLKQVNQLLLSKRSSTSAIAICDYLEDLQKRYHSKGSRLFLTDSIDVLEDFDEYMSVYYLVLV